MKAKLSILLRVLVSVGLLTFIAWNMRGQFPQIASTLKSTNILIFAGAVMIFMSINISLMSLRLYLLFSGEGLKVDFWKAFQLSYIGFFFNNFMPTAVGGDIVKAYYVQKQTGEPKKAFIAVFMDRFIGLFSFVGIAAIALMFAWDRIDPIIGKVIIVLAILSIVGFFFTLNSKVAEFLMKIFSKIKLWNLGKHISKIYMAIHDYKNKKTVILGVVLVSIVAQCIYFIVIYLITKSLSLNVPFVMIFLIMPIVCVVSLLPSLGGLGLREGAIVVLFSPIVGKDAAFSISILLLAMLLTLSIIGAIIYMSAAQFKIRKTDIEKVEEYRV